MHVLFHSNDIIMNQNNLDERREEEKVKSVCSFRKREYECVYVYAWRNYIFFITSSSLFSLDHFNDIVYLRTCVPSWLINFVVCDFFFLCVNSHHMKRVESRCIQTDFAYCVSMIHVRVKTVERTAEHWNYFILTIELIFVLKTMNSILIFNDWISWLPHLPFLTDQKSNFNMYFKSKANQKKCGMCEGE